MALNCYECGSTGHLAAACPNVEQLGGGHPMWCGTCDQHSRHWYDEQGRAHRCQCHGLSHLPLTQYRRCGLCKQTVYEWDQMDCDRHQPIGQPATVG
jgi:zinc knuckle protein